MPQIEELHSSSRAAAPGWSYVVDTGYDPSKVAINPTSSKRARTQINEGNSAGELSLRQQTAIQRHLNELDKDSYKDPQIVLPKSKLDASHKQTANVKRILGSGKDFAYYIAEEEALLSNKPPVAISQVTTGDTNTSKAATRPSKTPLARRKAPLVATQPSSESTPAPSTPLATASATSKSVAAPPPQRRPMLPPDTILEPRPPVFISDQELQTLLSAPALTYNAARSAPPPASAPPRRVFCEICGYWGRAKCMKCGARVCGIECRNTHDESRCLKFYA